MPVASPPHNAQKCVVTACPLRSRAVLLQAHTIQSLGHSALCTTPRALITLPADKRMRWQWQPCHCKGFESTLWDIPKFPAGSSFALYLKYTSIRLDSTGTEAAAESTLDFCSSHITVPTAGEPHVHRTFGTVRQGYFPREERNESDASATRARVSVRTSELRHGFSDTLPNKREHGIGDIEACGSKQRQQTNAKS